MNEQEVLEKMKLFSKTCLSFSDGSVLLRVRSASARLRSHFGDRKTTLEGKSSGRYIFETVWETLVFIVQIYGEPKTEASGVLTRAECFFCESPSTAFRFHIHIVRPFASESKSEEDSMTA
jgi:hypothetical protein